MKTKIHVPYVHCIPLCFCTYVSDTLQCFEEYDFGIPLCLWPTVSNDQLVRWHPVACCNAMYGIV